MFYLTVLLQSNFSNFFSFTLGTPDFTLIAPCCVYQIVVSDATGIIYGLTAEKTVVSRPLTTSLVPGGWTSLPPVTCTKLRTSKDGVLWCLSNGNILEWIPSKGRWTLAMSRSNCADFDVASTYIICTHSHALKRYPRSPEGIFIFFCNSTHNTVYLILLLFKKPTCIIIVFQMAKHLCNEKKLYHKKIYTHNSV